MFEPKLRSVRLRCAFKHALFSSTVTLFLYGCSSTQETLPTEPVVMEDLVTEPVVEVAEPIDEEAVVTGLAEEPEIVVLDDPWELVQQANSAPAYEVPGLLIRAINEFLDRGQISTAQLLAEQLQTYPVTPDERLSMNLIRARISAQTGNPDVALDIVNTLNLDLIRDPQITSQILVVRSEAETALGRNVDATSTLLDLDAYLDDRDQIQNQLTIVRQLQTMDALELSLLREKSLNPNLQSWIALADIMGVSDSSSISADLIIWQNLFPTHPLHKEVLDQMLGVTQQTHYRQVALLLPLTSAYGSAAKAFYDGFQEAHLRDPRFQRPDVVLYDIGEEADLSSLYYRAAINDGADFVVGPLGRKAVESLFENGVSETDTLVIASIPDANNAENLYGISLSPEAEARQIADKAWADGHRQATVFRIDSPWGQRVALAFVEQWQSLGGVIVKNAGFDKSSADYSKVIQKFLGLDKSIARSRLIQAKAGTKLKFTPRRNEDMDFLFLAGSSDQARLVVPQLRFFQAHDLPIYATSYAYSGKPEPGVDADLDGVKFGEMKWMLDGVELYRREAAREAARKAAEKAEKEAAVELAASAQGETEFAEAQAEAAESAETVGDSFDEASVMEEALDEQGSSEEVLLELSEMDDDLLEASELSAAELAEQPYQRPYLGSSLDRLYALGIQSYEILPRLQGLRSSSWQQFNGSAMTISVDETGAVVQQPIWTEFRGGLPTATTPYQSELEEFVEEERIEVSE